MGTPDLLGSYGTYPVVLEPHAAGTAYGWGIKKPIVFKDHVAKPKLSGPLNTLLKQPKETELEFSVYRHPQEPQARLEIGGQTILLKEGEWSGWITVAFPLDMPSSCRMTK